MAEKSLQDVLLDDLLGNSSKSPRENAAVAEILRLRQLLDSKHNVNPVIEADFIALQEKKHGKAGKGSTAKGKPELVTPK